MDFKAIQDLMSQMNSSDLIMLEIEADGVHIKMQKNVQQAETMNDVQKIQSQAMSVQESKSENTINILNSTDCMIVKEDKKEYSNVNIVTSPIVGTFYSSAAPDKPALVKVGDKVKKGQILCIIEAMKLMNEIESEFDGEIIEICVKNEQMVEYGQPLFKIV